MWQEDDLDSAHSIPGVCELVFRMTATTLPHDHALALSQAILDCLPWLAQEHSAGIHLVHYPGEVPDAGDDSKIAEEHFNVSRRTPLVLRLPRNRVADAASLSGKVLDIDGSALEVREARIKELVASDTLIARRVIHDNIAPESELVNTIVGHCDSIGISVRKIVCGQTSLIRLQHGPVSVRSVMITGLKPRDSITIQCSNLEVGRLLGCGLFLPHKGLGTDHGFAL